MARYLGKDADISVGGTDVGSVESIQLDESAEIFTSTALGDSAAQQDVGINSGTFSLTVFDDPEDTSGQGALDIGSSVSVVIYKRGSANTASPTRTFTGIISSISEPIGRDYARVTYSGVVDGAITRVLP